MEECRWPRLKGQKQIPYSNAICRGGKGESRLRRPKRLLQWKWGQTRKVSDWTRNIEKFWPWKEQKRAYSRWARGRSSGNGVLVPSFCYAWSVLPPFTVLLCFIHDPVALISHSKSLPTQKRPRYRLKNKCELKPNYSSNTNTHTLIGSNCERS